jgi:flagellar hook-associated protein 1 FlgK
MNQAAINLVNSNITNMNTEGYSKQRLEISQNVKAGKSDGTAMNASQSGLGAYIDTITRNRDVYLDSYYRTETTKLNYYSELQSNNLTLEDITNELSDSGVNKVLGDFYNAANELSSNPTDSVARTDFAQKAENVGLKLNHLYDQLNAYKSSIGGEASNPSTFNESRIGTEITSLNTKLQNLADINNTIIVSSSQNVTPNGLLDQRDKLLDDISKSLPIKIKHTPGNLVIVSLDGNDLVSGSKFMTKLEYDNKDQSGQETKNTPVIKLRQMDAPKNILVQNVNSLINSGKLGALIELTSNDSAKPNNINGLLDQLNTLTRNFAKELNDIQLSNDNDPNTISLSIDKSTTPPKLVEATEPLFTSSVTAIALQISSDTPDYSKLTAGNIKINSKILADPFKVAAAKLKLDEADPDAVAFQKSKTTYNTAKAAYDAITPSTSITTEQQATYDAALKAYNNAKTTYPVAAAADTYNTAKAIYDPAKTTYDAAKAIYDAIPTPNATQQSTYDAAKAIYDPIKANYDAAKTTYDTAKANNPTASVIDNYKTAKDAYTLAKTTYDAIATPSASEQAAYDTAKASYDTAKSAYIQRYNTQTGDGSNGLLFSQLRNKAITGLTGLNGSTTEQYVNTIMGKFGVQAGSVQDKLNSQSSVVEQVKAKRETAIGVNLDEELADLVKYQRAYEASSRVFNVVNQMLQQVMNLGK